MRAPRLVLAIAVALAGCATGTTPPLKKKGGSIVTTTASATPKPAATVTPRVALQGTLVGRARLIAGADGKLGTGATLISDSGGGVVSDHGGGIISNNAGAVIANNGAGVVSDHGGGYRVQQAAGLAAYALAEAVVALTDAKGEALKDAAGRAIEAKTDGQGEFAFTQAIPQGASVARIKLFNGGELRALVVNDGTELAVDLDTASTLGATYVLDQFVKGDGAVLAKLPRTEAERLHTELGAIEGFLGSAPGYQAADMVAATDKLRAKVKAVDTVIEDVRALLLGQKDLGSGLQATQVALAGPMGLLVDPAGNLLVGEGWPGRVRSIAPDGTLTTVMDGAAGRIKSNVLRLGDVALGADGTLVAASLTMGIYRAPAGATAVQNLQADFSALPQAVAIGPDGTLYVGEYTWSPPTKPKLLTLRADGTLGQIAVDTSWKGGRISGLHVAGDGTITLLYEAPDHAAQVYRIQGGTVTELAKPQNAAGEVGDMAVGPDGAIFLSLPSQKRVVRYDPASGALTPVAGAGAPQGGDALASPRSLAVGADGTLFIADPETGRVYKLTKDGTFSHFAGADAVVEDGATTSFALNQPTGVAFDANGDLLIVESGAGRIRRFRGGKLEAYIGTGSQTSGGDGGPAAAAQMAAPYSLVQRDGSLWIAETGGSRLRHVDAAGTITTLAGGGSPNAEPKLDLSVPAAGKGIAQPFGIAADAKGNVFYTSTQVNQVVRLAPDGTLRLIAGAYQWDDGSMFEPAYYLDRDETNPATKLGYPAGAAIGPDGALYFAEMIGCRIVKVEHADGGAPLKISRVAGRTMLEMMTRAGEVEAVTPEAVSPDGVPATQSSLALPMGVTFDAAGNMYVTEAGTQNLSALGGFSGIGASFGKDIFQIIGLPKMAGRVRKIAPDGTITTVAGHGSKWFGDDAAEDALKVPSCVAIAPDGRMAIADMGANMVRILPAGSY